MTDRKVVLKPGQRITVRGPRLGTTYTSLSAITLAAADRAIVSVEQPASSSIRAAFYYSWYPNTWTVNGVHVKYHPALGYYDSSWASVIDDHLDQLSYAGVQVLICSWWGQGKQRENTIFPILLERMAVKAPAMRLAFYYEKEGFADVPQAEINADLLYLKSHYGSAPACRVPLTVFVYNWPSSLSTICFKWASANTVGAYIDLKVFSGYASALPQPNGWHQYAPATAVQDVGSAYTISPGFWRCDEASPRLVRDPARWSQNVRDMVASPKPWHLITSFNEWGEGQSVEAATEWASASGFGVYLDALHSDGV